MDAAAVPGRGLAKNLHRLQGGCTFAKIYMVRHRLLRAMQQDMAQIRPRTR
jgi:hypothetical protein